MKDGISNFEVGETIDALEMSPQVVGQDIYNELRKLVPRGEPVTLTVSEIDHKDRTITIKAVK